MNKLSGLINERYEAMMFAKDAEVGRKAARALVRLVLGDQALNQPLEEALRETCRVLRPSTDPREQARFEAEFVELGLRPVASQSIAA